MSVEITVRETDQAVRVTVVGAIDPALAVMVGDGVRGVASADKPTVLDLRAVTMAGGDIDKLVETLLPAAAFPGRVVLGDPRVARPSADPVESPNAAECATSPGVTLTRRSLPRTRQAR